MPVLSISLAREAAVMQRIKKFQPEAVDKVKMIVQANIPEEVFSFPQIIDARTPPKRVKMCISEKA